MVDGAADSVLVFAGMSLLRTLGDLANPAFGFLPVDLWQALIGRRGPGV